MCASSSRMIEYNPRRVARRTSRHTRVSTQYIHRFVYVKRTVGRKIYWPRDDDVKMHAKHLTRPLTWLLSPLINKVDRPPTTRPINVVFVDNASSRRLDAQNTTIICICIWLPEKQPLPNPAHCNAELTQLHEFAMSRFPPRACVYLNTRM